jgi:hypothetical protein
MPPGGSMAGQMNAFDVQPRFGLCFWQGKTLGQSAGWELRREKNESLYILEYYYKTALMPRLRISRLRAMFFPLFVRNG